MTWEVASSELTANPVNARWLGAEDCWPIREGACGEEEESWQFSEQILILVSPFILHSIKVPSSMLAR